MVVARTSAQLEGLPFSVDAGCFGFVSDGSTTFPSPLHAASPRQLTRTPAATRLVALPRMATSLRTTAETTQNCRTGLFQLGSVVRVSLFFGARICHNSERFTALLV